MKTPAFTIAEIADVVHGELLADDSTIQVYRVAPLKEAGPDDLTFFYDRKLAKFVSATRAGVIVVGEKISSCQRPQIIVPQPDLAMIQLLELFYPSKEYQLGISAKAQVADSAVIDDQVTIFPGAYIGKGSILHAGVVIHPGVVVGNYCEIGVDTIIYPNVTIYDGCRIGERSLIHAGTVIGSDGYAFTWDGHRHRKIPQVGVVEIGNEVEIGANNTIDRAALTVTRIADGVKTDNLVHVAHNVQIGENSMLVAQVGIAGSTVVGKNVIMAGQAGVSGHLTIGDGAIIGPQAGVSRNIAPGEIVSGSPQMPHRDWLKTASIFSKLPEMWKKLRDLERHIALLREQLEGFIGDNDD